MSKNLKIQTMSDDLDELKGSSQKLSQQVEEKKGKPVADAIGAGDAVKRTETASANNIVNPERSIVESVISSMVNGKANKNEQEKNKPRLRSTKIKGEGSENKDVGELQNLVSRISETIPEKGSSSIIIEREEVLDQDKLPEPNIEPKNREAEERINREINSEMETRMNKEMERKIKSKTETTVVADLKAGKDLSISNKEKKGEDAEKLRSLIDRISKTAGKETAERNITEEVDKVSKKDRKKRSGILNSKENNIAEMPVAGKIREKTTLEFLDTDVKSAVGKVPEDISDHKKVESQEKKSFWSNISEKLKKGDNHKKVSEIKAAQNKKVPEMKNETKESNKSGILSKNDKKVEKIEKEKTSYLRSDEYVLPENRLIHGKQKFYSSVSKRIKLRKDKGEMKELKGISNIKKEQKILSREEEYKRLKKSIISKYHVKLFQLPWKKIIPVSLVVILMAGASFYYAMSVLVPKPVPPSSSDAIFGEELSEFMNIEKKITISEGSLKGFNNLEENARDIFMVNRKLKVIKLIVVNTEDRENRNILVLENSFDALDINKNDLPERFLEMSMNKYNLFIFKTEGDHIRYGIAIGLKDRYLMSEIMKEWEEERSANKKMITVLKPLFAGDKNYGDIYRPFSSANYSGVEVKYVHLIDENTALNYFIYNNNEENGNDLLVITTSKNDTHTIIDLLADIYR